MSLRIKSFLIINVVIFSSALILYFVVDNVMIDGLLKAERIDMSDHLSNAEKVLLAEQSRLDALAESSARASSPISKQSTNEQSEYKSSFPPARLSELNAHFYFELNENGDVLNESFSDDLMRGRSVAQDGIVSYIREQDPDQLAQSGNAGLSDVASSGTASSGTASSSAGLSGLHELNNLPVLISMRSIDEGIDNENKKFLVIGKYLDGGVASDLLNTSELSFSIHSLNNSKLPADLMTAKQKLPAAQQVFLLPASESRIMGYKLLNGASGGPVFILKIDSVREIFIQGKTLLDTFLIILLALALFISATVYFLMDNIVVKRLRKLGAKVKVRQSGNSDPEKATLHVGDEISILSQDIDQTYDELDSTRYELAESEDLFRNISVSALDGIMMVNKSGEIIYLNEAAKKLFSKHGSSDQGKLFCDDLISDESVSRKIRAFAEQASDLDNRVFGKTFEAMVCGDDDIRFPVELSVSASKVKGQWNALVVVRDISERREFELVRHMVRHDELTDLPNRLFFGENLQRAMGHAKRSGTMVAVLYFDIDNFKDINNALGHEFGDRLLLSVAGRLRATIRQEDSMARLGGDEFALLQENVTNVAQISSFAEKLLYILQDDFDLNEDHISITASVGISFFDPASLGQEEMIEPSLLLKQADIALFKAKNEGRNNFQFFDESASKIIENRMVVLRDLRKAIANEEFCLFYQPLIDAKSMTLFGAEALIRWKHPDKGLVMPGSFIEIAEASGLILPIGEWVLREACRQAALWQTIYGKSIHVGVNISVIQFDRLDLVSLIRAVLSETGLTPELLNIEITESHLITNVDKTLKTLNDVHEMGVTISLDDFGTGYSSLSYLDKFHVDYLKIDRQFIGYIDAEENSGVIAAATIALGHSLGINVVAEGVETLDQLNFLKHNGCDHIQGYYFSKPVSADEFANFFEAKYVGSSS